MTPKSFNALSLRLHGLSGKVNNDITSVISGTRCRPSLVADAWSDSSMYSYLGSMWLLSAADLMLKTFVLGVYPLVGSQTAEYLLQRTKQILAEFDLDLFSIFKFLAVPANDDDSQDDEEQEWENGEEASGEVCYTLILIAQQMA
uniref:Uncharacterized protein n=1 Tax=Ditylenchus dipsaci TaxID=166011 RepID=A0A915CYS0_9BILA